MMKLALGPVQYYWPREKLFTFYERVAGLPVDIVYLGETVCSRRHEMKAADWLAVAGLLKTAGKQVVLSTQVLLESVSDVTAMRRFVENGEFMVEANDMGAVRCAAGRVPFVAGPHLNLYNAEALEVVVGAGAVRWVTPPDMNQRDLAGMQALRPEGLQTEALAFGRLPLAYSARCFTARHHDLPKDDCGFRCIEDAEGLLLRTREGEPFLVINGIQTQSARIHNLLPALGTLGDLGIDVLRLSPQGDAMAQVIGLFDGVRRGSIEPRSAELALRDMLVAHECNGFWHARPGLELVENA